MFYWIKSLIENIQNVITMRKFSRNCKKGKHLMTPWGCVNCGHGFRDKVIIKIVLHEEKSCYYLEPPKKCSKLRFGEAYI